MSTPDITQTLDRLEANLPVIPARVVRFQRTFYGATYDKSAAVVYAIAESTKNFLDTARTSGKTVTGQARAAGSDFATTTKTGVKTVTGQARAAGADIAKSTRTGVKAVAGQAKASGSDVAKSTKTGVKTVTGQAGAQTKRVAKTTKTGAKTVAGQATAQGKKVSTKATTETTKLLDSAIDAVDDAPTSGTPYEQWTKAELVDRAQELDIEGRSGLNKQELISALRKA